MVQARRLFGFAGCDEEVGTEGTRGYAENGLTIEEFDGFPPTRRTLRPFIAACHDLDSLVRDFMLPNPELTVEGGAHRPNSGQVSLVEFCVRGQAMGMLIWSGSDKILGTIVEQ